MAKNTAIAYSGELRFDEWRIAYHVVDEGKYLTLRYLQPASSEAPDGAEIRRALAELIKSNQFRNAFLALNHLDSKPVMIAGDTQKESNNRIFIPVYRWTKPVIEEPKAKPEQEPEPQPEPTAEKETYESPEFAKLAGCAVGVVLALGLGYAYWKSRR